MNDDIDDKLTGSTGLVPTSITTRCGTCGDLGFERNIRFAGDLTADEKENLDAFMSSRGYAYVRKDAAPSALVWVPPYSEGATENEPAVPAGQMTIWKDTTLNKWYHVYGTDGTVLGNKKGELTTI